MEAESSKRKKAAWKAKKKAHNFETFSEDPKNTSNFDSKRKKPLCNEDNQLPNCLEQANLNRLKDFPDGSCEQIDNTSSPVANGTMDIYLTR